MYGFGPFSTQLGPAKPPAISIKTFLRFAPINSRLQGCLAFGDKRIPHFRVRQLMGIDRRVVRVYPPQPLKRPPAWDRRRIFGRMAIYPRHLRYALCPSTSAIIWAPAVAPFFCNCWALLRRRRRKTRGKAATTC